MGRGGSSLEGAKLYKVEEEVVSDNLKCGDSILPVDMWNMKAWVENNT